jgi:heavy metal sensor kinase
MRKSIRWRLTLWNTLALAVVLIGVVVLVYGLVSYSLYGQLDRNLQGAVQLLEQDERIAGDREKRLLYWLEEFKEHLNLVGVIYSPDGGVLAKTTELAGDAVPPSPRNATTQLRFRTIVVPIMGRQRLGEARLRLAGHDCIVVVMASLDEVDRELGRLLAALTATVPVALLVSLALGYWLARKALAPMERLRNETEAITIERLDQRLPIENQQDEVGRLAGTINDMIGRLERSFGEIRRFTADASHELRTPITVIRTEAEVALVKPLTLQEHQQLLGSILEECERLTQLTDQLLTLAREDAGQSRREHQPLDLTQLLEQVADTMRPLTEARRQHFEVALDGPAPMDGDESRLRQVFYNLIGNACKYTPEEGTITVRLEATRTAATVTVSDTGIGIPPEHLPHVFERFYRVDKARTRADGGTGLGLSIARSIITAHGGTIDLTSSPGQGTTCTVSLPLSEDKAWPSQGESSVKPI